MQRQELTCDCALRQLFLRIRCGTKKKYGRPLQKQKKELMSKVKSNRFSTPVANDIDILLMVTVTTTSHQSLKSPRAPVAEYVCIPKVSGYLPHLQSEQAGPTVLCSSRYSEHSISQHTAAVEAKKSYTRR